jgi:signal transduction histidine kinase
VFFAILLLGGCDSDEQASPEVPRSGWEAVQGIQDLREWNFDNKSVAALNGEWAFYWKQLLDPQQVSESQFTRQPENWIQLPHAWNGKQVGDETLTGNGYATFHLEVEMEPSAQVLALELPIIRTTYELWINGQPVASGGKVGIDSNSSKPANLPQLVIFPQDNAAHLDIVLQVSNFDHRLGGIVNELMLGEAKQMVSRHDRRMGLDMLLVGSLLLMGFYNLGLFLIRLKEKCSLYLGLFCLVIGIRAMLVGEGAMFQLFPRLEWVTSLRIEYVSFYMGVASALVFCYSLYPKETHLRVVQTVSWSCAAFSIATLLLPPWIFTSMLQTYQWITALVCVYVIIVLIKAFLAQRDGALFIQTGVIVYIVTVIIDIAQYHQWIQFGGISPIGLFYAIFMASFIISMKSFQAFSSVETLSRQLRDLNMGLEYRIKERTVELEHSNRTLEKINEDLARLETSRRHLLSNISHDLGTPMTLIQGYVEALIDRVVVGPEQQDKYLRLILSRINGLNRLIADLFQLSKLEARQIDFSMQELTVEQFIEYFSERYAVEVNTAGLRFSFHSNSHTKLGQVLDLLVIDVNRIDQVFTNIIYNAIKHTSVGGLIQLQLLMESRSLVLKIQDNGIGIEPEDLPFIFDRFYKKDKSRNSAAGGSGLGLAIAKEIVDFHGGRIWAESKVGQGTSICFVLPLRTASQSQAL